MRSQTANNPVTDGRGRAGFIPATNNPAAGAADSRRKAGSTPPRYRGYQRCSRIDYANAENMFSVTICVKPRRPVFISRMTNTAAVRDILRLHQEGWAGVHLYCLMPDHIHLVLAPGCDGLSVAIRRLKGRFSVWWRRNGDGQTLWQQGFFDHKIRTTENFKQQCDYVLENPVRAGLVERAEDYEWSGSLSYTWLADSRGRAGLIPATENPTADSRRKAGSTGPETRGVEQGHRAD